MGKEEKEGNTVNVEDPLCSRGTQESARKHQ